MRSSKNNFSQDELNQRIEMRVIRFDDVIALTGLSKSTIYRRMEEKQFPKSISLGGRSVGWYEHEVKNWLKGLKPSDT